MSSNSDSFVKNQKTRLIPKGNRSPPLMRLSKYPTFEELGHWRKMHENTFFNRNRIVKEEDVLESLRFADPRTKISTMPPSSYVILKPQNIYRTKYINERREHCKTEQYLKYLPHKFHDHRKRSAITKEKEFTPVRFHPSPVPPPQKKTFEALPKDKTKSSSKTLLRRPLLSIWKTTETKTSNSNISENDNVDLEQWRKSSLTTIFKDDPLDPDNFYNKHYPLLLKKVPKRFKNEEGKSDMGMCDAMYRPLSKTPDIDMRYFNTCLKTSLSQEVILPPKT